jgi:O-acetyl-ADP-ribose deacetylase (regulator of RNase III)
MPTPPAVSPAPYAHLIDLDVVFDRRVAEEPSRAGQVSAELLDWLLRDAGLTDSDVPRGAYEQRRLIDRLLTVRPPRPFPAAAQSGLDALWSTESASRPVVDRNRLIATSAMSTDIGNTRVHLWRGDITTLALDAIVNAANAQLLGCFRPEHACIDNAIHRVAGPRLRQDCARIMASQGHNEPTGTAKATRAYYLPARFVFHTVGPIVTGGRPSAAQRLELARSYESCLELAAALALQSIAFCAISTGVFGYPKIDAADVAMTTVKTWLAEHPGILDTVVFDVFSEDDERVYRELSWGKQ